MSEENLNSTSSEQKTEKKSLGIWWKKLPMWAQTVLIFLMVVLVVGIVGGAYFIGVKNSKAEPSPSPSPSLVPSPTPDFVEEEEIEVSPTPVPTVIPTSTPTPTPTPEPEILSKSLTSSASLDGFQSSNGGGNDGVDIRVGRNSILIIRGFVSFDISDIPDGATITEAKLAMYLARVIGDPVGAGVRVKVDHLDYGDTFENSDYNQPSLSGSFGTLTEADSIGWKEVRVDDQVQADLDAGRNRSQFRIHLAVENIGGNVTGDSMYFESADNSESTGNIPQLNLKYVE
jgi:hypothetical protein